MRNAIAAVGGPPIFERPLQIVRPVFPEVNKFIAPFQAAGWVGLFLFLMIFGYSWVNCVWLTRHSRNRPDLAWANLLGRMGQAVLAGYATAGAFASQAYLDEYWCIIFIFDAARRLLAKEISPAGAFAGAGSRRQPFPRQAVTPAVLAKPDNALGYAKSNL